MKTKITRRIVPLFLGTAFLFWPFFLLDGCRPDTCPPGEVCLVEMVA